MKPAVKFRRKCYANEEHQRQQVYSHRNFTNEIYSLLKTGSTGYNITELRQEHWVHSPLPLVEFKADIFTSSSTDRLPKLPGGRGAPTFSKHYINLTLKSKWRLQTRLGLCLTLVGKISRLMIVVMYIYPSEIGPDRTYYFFQMAVVVLTWVMNGSGLPKVGGGRSWWWRSWS